MRSHSVSIKRDRMHLRLDAKTKRKLERAAAYEETSISDFVLGQAIAAADRVIEAHERITLSPVDWDAFYGALINPPQPNKKLRSAARRYRERVGE
jgi:uncharacterized protein (DUF1778 family)